MSREIERPAALLTKAQRAWLRGEKEYKTSAEQNLQRRMRKRLRASILDISLLINENELSEIDEGLSEPEEYEGRPGTSPPVAESMKSLPTLLYLYHREVELESDEKSDGWRTAKDVETGIETALHRMGIDGEVDVSIDVDRGPKLSELTDGVELTDLSYRQLTELERAGEIGIDQYVRAYREKVERGDEQGGNWHHVEK